MYTYVYTTQTPTDYRPTDSVIETGADTLHLLPVMWITLIQLYTVVHFHNRLLAEKPHQTAYVIRTKMIGKEGGGCTPLSVCSTLNF